MTTVERKLYNTEGSGSVLGLPCETVSEEFDGSVNAGDLKIEDAFNVEEISISSTPGTGIMKLAADIATVKLQPRLIPSGISSPKVNGLQCTKNTTLQDGVWLDCGTTLTEATPQTVCALNASDDAVKALMQEVSQVLGIPCASLWQIGDTSGVVSYSGYTDGEALMDGRSTMSGYPVSDGAEMVWTALGSAQLMALNASIDTNTGKSLLCRLLTMLGMPETMAQQEQAALSGGRLAVPTVSADGVIELKNDDDTNPLIVGTEAKSRLLYKNGTSNAQWISVNADGGSMLQWLDNKGDVFALLAGMAKKAMDSICGIGLVGVGVNGGVMGWMVSAHDTYGIPLGNLVKAYAEFQNVRYSFEKTADNKYGYIKNSGVAFVNLNIMAQTFPINIKGRVKFYAFKSEADFFGNWNSGGFEVGVRNTNLGMYAGAWWNPVSLSANTPYNISVGATSGAKTLVLNETSYETASSNVITSTSAVALMSGRSNGYCTPDMAGSFFEIIINGTKLFLVPFYRNNEYGMLNLLAEDITADSAFYKNANTSGSFTYSLE